ncbi:MAG: hypothetical protein FWF18_06115 [Dehalococcoidia bacterium]|nr:hypothetical protein [Dehalococcoidia bacterium]
MKKTHKKLTSLALAVILAVSTLGTSVLAAPQTTQPIFYNISNPYANVNWTTSGQYNAANHTHSTFSDGSNFRRDMLLDKYAKNFDIVAMTDHDTTTTAWDAWTAPGSWDNNWNGIGMDVSTYLTAEELAAINAGTFNRINPSLGTYNGNRTKSTGMISMGESNETSAEGERFNGGGSNFRNHHINAFFTTGLPGDVGQDRNNSSDFGRTMDEVIKEVAARGGITHLNHPGRYTGGQNNATRSSDPAIVGKYVELFMDNQSCVGMEIINKWDGESINDRILWDNILSQTMPQGRGVWGFTNDDSHSLSGNGHAWNVMLMPTLSQAGTKASMETGAFYGVSRIDRKHGVNNIGTPGAPNQTLNTATMYSGGDHNQMALSFLTQGATPSISNIMVNGNTITISGNDFNMIVWYSGTENDASKVIATGNSIDVSQYADAIANGYVRAELVGTTGVAYTQPFGISEATVKTASTSTKSFISMKETVKNSNVWTLTFNATVMYSNGTSKIAEYSVNLKGNNANQDGKYVFGADHELAGFTLNYDIKGNGSNIKTLELR